MVAAQGVRTGARSKFRSPQDMQAAMNKALGNIPEGEIVEGEVTLTKSDTNSQPVQARERDIDAGRWRRLINASEMAFPALTIAEDPDNYCVLHYGRKALEKLVDRHDEISETYQSGDTGRLDWLANNPVEALDIFGHTRPGEAREVRIDIDAAMSGF